jgi:hypothetical protein
MPVCSTSESPADRTRAAGMAMRGLGALARSPPPPVTAESDRTDSRDPARKVPLMPEVVFSVDQSKSMRDQAVPGHNRWHPAIPRAAFVQPGSEFRVEGR